MTRSKAIKIILREIQKMGANTVIWQAYDFEKINLRRAEIMVETKPGGFIGTFDPDKYIRQCITLEDLLACVQNSATDLTERVTYFRDNRAIPTYHDIIRKMGLGLFDYKSIENYPEIFPDSKAACEEYYKEHKNEIDKHTEELLRSYKSFIQAPYKTYVNIDSNTFKIY